MVINITGLNGCATAGSSGCTWNFTSNGLTTNGAVWSSALNEQLIWNFTDATASTLLNVNSELHGSVLDPNGAVSNSTPIEGSVVASVFKQGGEVHLGTLAGDYSDSAASSAFTALASTQSAAVPEPATWSMMILGFGAVGGLVRRQRRQGAASVA